MRRRVGVHSPPPQKKSIAVEFPSAVVGPTEARPPINACSLRPVSHRWLLMDSTALPLREYPPQARTPDGPRTMGPPPAAVRTREGCCSPEPCAPSAEFCLTTRHLLRGGGGGGATY